MPTSQVRPQQASKCPPSPQHADPYHTRTGQERVIERTDPVLYGVAPQGPSSLTAPQLQQYARDGYLVVPDVFTTEEVDVLRATTADLCSSPRLQGRDELVIEPDSQEPRSLFSPQRFSPLFERIVRDARILDKVEQVLASPVYLHHARVNIKGAFSGRSFPWHSDFETWHAEDGMPLPRAVSAWIMLSENNRFNGPLFAMPGSHRVFVGCAGSTPDENYRQSLRHQQAGTPSGLVMRQLAERFGLDSVEGTVGSLVLHECNLMHGSPDNLSPWPRTNLFFVYNSVTNPPAERPFAATRFRPEFLACRGAVPLR